MFDLMAWKTKVLVVANRTADSDDLLQALKERASQGEAAFTLLAPATILPDGGRAAARERAREQVASAAERMRDAGLEVEEELVGDPDPVDAVHDIWDASKFDEIIVSTLPSSASGWLGVDVPHRLEKATQARVSHIVSQERRPSAAPGPPRSRRARLADAFLPERWANPR
jgi:nucleotide-binding universal stress UspA family protein